MFLSLVDAGQSKAFPKKYPRVNNYYTLVRNHLQISCHINGSLNNFSEPALHVRKLSLAYNPITLSTMPSTLCSSPSHHQKQYLQALLKSARPFLRGELETIDNKLPAVVSVLRSVGASECWHKHSTFFQHLFNVFRVLKLWKAPDSVCFCGLFHSAYSNSYASNAIFDPSGGRDTVRSLVGEVAESLIHLFCIIPRQQMIHDDLLFKYTDTELVEHLKVSQVSLMNATEKGFFNEEEAWRKKLQSLLPADGVKVKHIRTGEDILISRRLMATFVMMTMADFSDQFFGFQDILFENLDGRLEFTGNNYVALWPGDGKPGLWMNSVSRMGAIYTLLVREEEIFIEQRRRNGHDGMVTDRDEEIELVLPPVFENCTEMLDAREQILARDLYWEAVYDASRSELELERAEELLLKCIDKNPYVGEPHVMLAQIYLNLGRFEEAEGEAEKGVILLLEWGSPWDKRISWEGWTAWARVLLKKAKEKSWPQHSWGILDLGLVR